MDISPIKAIIFDCFGVITTDSWRAFCDTLSPDLLQEARGLNKQRDLGLIDHQTFIADISMLTNQEQNDIDQLLKNEVVKNDALLQYVAELKKQGFKIGMLSNIASNWIRDTLLTLKEQELFDEMIFSYEVGMAKPDPRIFLLACERLRVSTHEAVLVDDIDTYCEAARSEGLEAVVYSDLNQLKAELNLLLYPE